MSGKQANVRLDPARDLPQAVFSAHVGSSAPPERCRGDST